MTGTVGLTTQTTLDVSSGGGGAVKSSRRSRRKGNKGTNEVVADSPFGGEVAMSESFDKFCKKKIMDLTGSDDLTLVHFLMSLSDASEVRQYCVMTLGDKEGVKEFADEFIVRKEKEASFLGGGITGGESGGGGGGGFEKVGPGGRKKSKGKKQNANHLLGFQPAGFGGREIESGHGMM